MKTFILFAYEPCGVQPHYQLDTKGRKWRSLKWGFWVRTWKKIGGFE